MVKVSIIVPVYNAEKFLKKCIDTLVNQTLQEIEIILIDDASKDNSKDIIKEYGLKYSNKIVFELLENNQGQGHARNIGIEKANGEYILFVDSDDYIAKNTCEVLYNKAGEKNYDIICFDWCEIINNKVIKKYLAYDILNERKISNELRGNLVGSKGYFTTRMYKKSLIKDNNIKFPERINYEDSVFNSLTLLYAKSIAKINENLYFYTIREGSSSNCYNEERLYDRITTTQIMMSEVKRRGLYNKFTNIINRKYFRMMVGNIHLCFDMFDKVNFDKLNSINNDIKSNFSNYREIKEYKELDKVSKIYIVLNDKSPKLLFLVDKLYKILLKIYKRD